MTALDAFRDGPPPEPQGDGAPWPDDGPGTIAAGPSGSAANALTRPPPVPAPSGPPCLLAADGTRLLAGLTWEIASGPEAPVLRGDAPHVLRLPDRRARLADTDGGPGGSLLLQMAADLVAVFFPAASGPWAFIAEIPAPDGPPALWMAIADVAPTGATPRPGPELLFDDPEDALAALQEHLDITDIEGIAARWLPVRAGMTPDDTHRGRMIMGIAEIAGTVELEDVGPDALPPDGADRDAAAAARLPVFAPPRQVPVRLLGGLASVAGAVLAGFLVVVPMVEAAFRAPPPPPPETVSVRVAEGAFAGACTEALDAWWPRITGWQVGSAGCAVAGHLPDEPVLPEPRAADRLGRPMVVWRHLVPERGRNSVLARSAADQMVAAWPHEARIDPDGLTLWRTASLPMTEASDSEIATAPDAEATRARLAGLWADTPDAVTLRLDPGSVLDLFEVRSPGATPADVILSRAARVPGIAPRRLVQSAAAGDTLVLAPVGFRDVPVTLLEATKGGPSR